MAEVKEIHVIDLTLKSETPAKCSLFTETFVRSTTIAFYESLTQPPATDTILTATPKCPYQQF